MLIFLKESYQINNLSVPLRKKTPPPQKEDTKIVPKGEIIKSRSNKIENRNLQRKLVKTITITDPLKRSIQLINF